MAKNKCEPAEIGQEYIKTTLRAHRRRYRLLFWVMDENYEKLLNADVGDCWEIILVRKLTKENVTRWYEERDKVNTGQG